LQEGIQDCHALFWSGFWYGGSALSSCKRVDRVDTHRLGVASGTAAAVGAVAAAAGVFSPECV
jgi:hypothetical protein